MAPAGSVSFSITISPESGGPLSHVHLTVSPGLDLEVARRAGMSAVDGLAEASSSQVSRLSSIPSGGASSATW